LSPFIFYLFILVCEENKGSEQEFKKWIKIWRV
jgi:hypothetical protein